MHSCGSSLQLNGQCHRPHSSAVTLAGEVTGRWLAHAQWLWLCNHACSQLRRVSKACPTSRGTVPHQHCVDAAALKATICVCGQVSVQRFGNAPRADSTPGATDSAGWAMHCWPQSPLQAVRQYERARSLKGARWSSIYRRERSNCTF